MLRFATAFAVAIAMGGFWALAAAIAAALLRTDPLLPATWVAIVAGGLSGLGYLLVCDPRPR